MPLDEVVFVLQVPSTFVLYRPSQTLQHTFESLFQVLKQWSLTDSHNEPIPSPFFKKGK